MSAEEDVTCQCSTAIRCSSVRRISFRWIPARSVYSCTFTSNRCQWASCDCGRHWKSRLNPCALWVREGVFGGCGSVCCDILDGIYENKLRWIGKRLGPFQAFNRRTLKKCAAYLRIRTSISLWSPSLLLHFTWGCSNSFRKSASLSHFLCLCRSSCYSIFWLSRTTSAFGETRLLLLAYPHEQVCEPARSPFFVLRFNERFLLLLVTWRSFSSVIILLYLIEENTSLLVLVPSSIGALIEFWKLSRVWKVRLGGGRLLQFEARSSEECATESFDSQAMRYLSIPLLPLCIGAAIYSLIYVPHKRWERRDPKIPVCE